MGAGLPGGRPRSRPWRCSSVRAQRCMNMPPGSTCNPEGLLTAICSNFILVSETEACRAQSWHLIPDCAHLLGLCVSRAPSVRTHALRAGKSLTLDLSGQQSIHKNGSLDPNWWQRSARLRKHDGSDIQRTRTDTDMRCHHIHHIRVLVAAPERTAINKLAGRGTCQIVIFKQDAQCIGR